VGWFHCTIYSYIGSGSIKYYSLDPSYDFYGLVYQTQWGGAKNEFIQWGNEVFVDYLIVCLVFLLPKHLVVDVYRDVGGKPTPSHVWVPVSGTHYV
jgi:hypothetical protein